MKNIDLQVEYDPVEAETVNAVTVRAEALVTQLITKVIPKSTIISSLSPIITHNVIKTFKEAAGDFDYIMPYALLQASIWFEKKSRDDVSEVDLDSCRSLACQTIARRLVDTYSIVEQSSLLTTRFVEHPKSYSYASAALGERPTSSLELAVDSNSTEFLSSPACQRVVQGLWRGFFAYASTSDGGCKLVISPPEGRGITNLHVGGQPDEEQDQLSSSCVQGSHSHRRQYHQQKQQQVCYENTSNSESSHFSSSSPTSILNRSEDNSENEQTSQMTVTGAYQFTRKLAVPLYQFAFRSVLWMVFLLAYTIAVKTPYRDFGVEDVVLYIQVVGYMLEDFVSIYKVSLAKAMSIWLVVNWGINTLLWISFAYRLASLWSTDPEKEQHYRRLTFEFMSVAAPLIWLKLLSVFDLSSYIGTLQIVLVRMLRESVVFLVLVGILAIGFLQAYAGLDMGVHPSFVVTVINDLLAAMMGSPPFESYQNPSSPMYPFSVILLYCWVFFTTVILLNILIAMFGTAYAQTVDNVDAQFRAFFAHKTVSYVRAPDQYVYPAPFNVIEILFIAPFERFMSSKSYAKLNECVMSVLFFIPFCFIALYEKLYHQTIISWYDRIIYNPPDFEASEKDPQVPYGERPNTQISKYSFDSLVAKFPSTTPIESHDENEKTILSDLQEIETRILRLKAYIERKLP